MVNSASVAKVTTPEACLAFVNEMEFCTWREQPKLPDFPSLEMQTPWRRMELTHETWFWKDDLHVERQLFYGPLIAPDIPVFVSLSLLPALIAAQGDIDARTLHEKGLVASNGLRVYEHVALMGPTATGLLPWPRGSRMLYLAQLQQKFLLTKHDITGRTRATYGYRWCLTEDAFPESFATASRIAVADAREEVVARLRRHGSTITAERAARLFRWQPI
jgi:hypothetical protein